MSSHQHVLPTRRQPWSDRAGVPAPGAGRPFVARAAGVSHRTRWRRGERLHHLFEQRCDRLRRDGRAGQLAVDAPGARLTYAELDARANRLARHLLDRGVRPGQRVALLLDDPVASYAATLAALKVGAAYVPLDVAFPDDRLAYIVEDSEAAVVLTLSHLRDRVSGTRARLVCLDEDAVPIAARAAGRLTPEERGPDVDQLAYVIYTSGSTGRPKGVAVEHASICNFLRVADETYGILPGDRVYQGMTIAFDFSVEEIWVPWMAGATLVPKPAGSSLVGRDLGEFLRNERVTALCCVPTLLATLDEDLPQLRFLLVSGEACPRDLVARWHRPGLRFLNVYGPTETTVTATWTVLHPDRPVTIGRPLPTYAVVVLDPETQEPLPAGSSGEIAIAGPGLARGYVNRDDLTRRAFIRDPLGLDHNPSGRLYRSGDLGRVLPDGEIEYQGRIDTQVKIRGFRIELTEIESVMLQVPGVAQAVVDTHEPEPGVKELAGYFTTRTGGAGVAGVETVHRWLREHLPPYMVPAYLEELDVIPMLPSDKADRKALPPPRGPRFHLRRGEHVAPADDRERALAATLAQVLRLPDVSVDSHVFDELGADSLLMARFCARLRTDHPDLPNVSMQDVYVHPTVRRLAAALADAQPAEPEPSVPGVEERSQARTSQYVLCGVLQLLVFVAYTGLTALVAVASFSWVGAGSGLFDSYLRSVASGAVTFLFLSLAPVAVKWLLVGRWSEREIDVWSPGYVRFWVVKTLVRANPLALFVGSPLYVLYLRALGARIGPGVTILSRTVPVCTDLLAIGAGTVIRKDSFFPCYRARAGRIETGRVTIGADAWVGEKTVLDIGVGVGDGAQLGHCSSLHAPQTVPAGQTWHGSPAVPATVDYRTVAPAACRTRRRLTYGALQLLGALVLVLPVSLGAIGAFLEEAIGLDALSPGDWLFYGDVALVTLVVWFAPVLGGLVLATTVPRLLHRALEPDRVYPLYGFHYAVHRTVMRMTNLKFYVDLFGDSSYIVHYLRAVGYRMKAVQQTGSNFGTEVGHESPYLVSIGSGTMVSDSLSLMTAEYSSTSFRLVPVAVGERNFLGNNIAFPAGARTGENCLLATKVMVPLDGPVREGVGLLGSPCFEIPRSVDRDVAHTLSGEEQQRALAGKNRYNLTTMGLFLLVRWFRFFLLSLVMLLALHHHDGHGLLAVWAALLVLPVVTVAYGVFVERAAGGFRRLQPRTCSIYDPHFWWHERLWKLLTAPIFNGTPFKNLEWRLLGVRMGRRVFDDGCDMPEKTLVTIGDDCTLNAGSVIQCHSLEDGTFKSAPTVLGAGCTLGLESFVHYGVTMGDGSVLEADAFLMKGEEVPAGAHWRGNPARPARALHAAPTPPPGGGSGSGVGPGSAVVATPPELPAAPAPSRSRPRQALTPSRTPASPPSVPVDRLLADLSCRVTDVVPVPAGVSLSVLALDRCRDLEDPLLELLSQQERVRAHMIPSPRRDTFVARQALLRAVLTSSVSAEVPPSGWRVTRSAAGAPVVAAPDGALVHVGVSHTEHVLVVAVSSQPVGVDLEPLASARDGVVWDVLTPAERRDLEALPGRRRASRFLQMWTLKEAYLKCVGSGSAAGLHDVESAPDIPAVLRGPVPDGQQSPSWYGQQVVTVDGRRYWLALAGLASAALSPAAAADALDEDRPAAAGL